MSKNSSDKESEVDLINENPLKLDHLFTTKLKDTESDLTLRKRSNEKIHENENIENLENSVLNINAEIMALKIIIKYEIYNLSKNIN